MWKYNNTCLAHHGRQNQKWGVRNGPPYPLDIKGGYNVGIKSAEEERNLHLENKQSGGDSNNTSSLNKPIQKPVENASHPQNGSSNNSQQHHENKPKENRSDLKKKNDNLRDEIENLRLKKELKKEKRGPVNNFIRNTFKHAVVDPAVAGTRQAVNDVAKEAGSRYLKNMLGLRNKDLENAKQLNELLKTNKEIQSTMYTLKEGKQQFRENLKAELERQNAAKKAETAYNYRVAQENKYVTKDRWKSYRNSIDAKMKVGTYKAPSSYQMHEITEKQKQQNQNQNNKKKKKRK